MADTDNELNEILNNSGISEAPAFSNKVVVTVNGRDEIFDYDQLGVTFYSTEEEILRAVNGIISEMSTASLRDDNDGDFTYTVRKATNTQNVYVYPKPEAGC